MTNLTNNEKILIEKLLKSDFNGDTLVFDKKWEEQKLENSDYFIDMVDIKWYSRILNLEINATKGVFGSLVKKDLVSVIEDEEDDGKPFTWLTINEEQFNRIKGAVA